MVIRRGDTRGIIENRMALVRKAAKIQRKRVMIWPVLGGFTCLVILFFFV